ncbi:MAG: hypothetical protein RL199_2401 [Pseudomonadota bacterium]|jgi:hypothetical protein
MSRSVWYALALTPLVAVAAEAGLKPRTAAAGGQVDMNCGRMLEKHSAIPAKAEQLFAAAADALDAHAQWVGTRDKGGKKENETLMKLAKDDREAMERMRKLTEQLTKGARDIGSVPHDTSSPLMAKALDADARYARTARELAQILNQDADDTEQRIGKLRQGSGGN